MNTRLEIHAMRSLYLSIYLCASPTPHTLQYIAVRELGNGAFATVYEVIREGDLKHFAIKSFSKSLLKRKKNFKRVNGKLVISSNLDFVKREVCLHIEL